MFGARQLRRTPPGGALVGAPLRGTMTPPVVCVGDARDVERDLLAAQETLRRIVAQADACLASVADRARVSRRVRTAARRRALHAAA